MPEIDVNLVYIEDVPDFTQDGGASSFYTI